jgi:hypothetical protein
VVERDGILYVVGERDGTCYVRRTADYGKTWLKYSDDSIEKAIGPVPGDQRAGLVKLVGQGRALVALLPQWPDIVVYVSFDDGETWSEESRIRT